VYRKLENVFKELQTLFPSTPSCAIVNAQGELLYVPIYILIHYIFILFLIFNLFTIR
jgi:hypothetical protein